VQLLDDWIAFQKQPVGNFEAWCKENGRSYTWLKAYYYKEP